MSSPPSSGPLTVPSPAVTPKPASALIRSRGREDDLDHGEHLGHHDRAESALGDPAADQHARAVAAPHSADMTVKPATPMRNSRFRPKMSPSRPPVISTSA